MIEQLKGLLRVREAQEQKMQQELGDRPNQDAGEDADRIERQRFAPQQIRTNRFADRPPRDDYVFERGSYAP